METRYVGVEDALGRVPIIRPLGRVMPPKYLQIFMATEGQAIARPGSRGAIRGQRERSGPWRVGCERQQMVLLIIEDRQWRGLGYKSEAVDHSEMQESVPGGVPGASHDGQGGMGYLELPERELRAFI